MKNVPAYYLKNAAVGTALRVMNGKKAAPDAMRETVGQVVSWCILIALAGYMGWNHEQMEKFEEKKCRISEDFRVRARVNGEAAAEKWLDGEVKPLHFTLPPDKPIKKRADRDELAQKRMGADVAWKLMGLTMLQMQKPDMQMDAMDAQNVLNEAKSVYNDRFLDWAREGDAYGMERLKQDVEAVLGEQVDVTDDGRGAIFSDKLY